jgi:hypothetical protein
MASNQINDIQPFQQKEQQHSRHRREHEPQLESRPRPRAHFCCDYWHEALQCKYRHNHGLRFIGPTVVTTRNQAARSQLWKPPKQGISDHEGNP